MKRSKELGELYGNVYIEGLAKELETARKESEQSRLREREAQRELSGARGDRVRLQAVAKRYKKLAECIAKSSPQKDPSALSDSTSSLFTG